MHISYQTGNKIKKRTHFSKSLLSNKLQRANSFLLIFGMWHYAPQPFFLGRFAPHRLRHFAPPILSRYSQTAYSDTPRGIMPHPYCGILPRRGIMPQCFLLIYFFWHDFHLFGTLLARFFYFWHAINPYHQTSYKVPRFSRCKLLVSKGLRRAGRARLS